jgi:superfamily I DNA/RNA helicase
LLAKRVSDVDGNIEERTGTISFFNGPTPTVRLYDSEDAETVAVGRWLAERAAEGVAAGEMCVFVRSAAELPRARQAVETAGLPLAILGDDAKTVRDRVSVGRMHLGKGLEFRAVVVMACDDEVLPLQGRIEGVTDESDLAEVYDTERHLLYVACTRARDHLLVTGVKPESEFLSDLLRRDS